MKSEEDTKGYGYFCDLESAKINEYEYAEYYVATTSVSYEVRRKFMIKSETPDTKVLEVDLEDPPCYVFQKDDESKQGCFYNVVRFFGNVKRDIYYSILICFITAISVIIIMA
jgi:hypothetical protein